MNVTRRAGIVMVEQKKEPVNRKVILEKTEEGTPVTDSRSNIRNEVPIKPPPPPPKKKK
jgi:hypothetical protein